MSNSKYSTEISIADLYDWKEVCKTASDLLKKGEVVALPTETVYGLAAVATNEAAVAKVFDIKERPSFDPLIVHIASVNEIDQVAQLTDGLKKAVNILADKFWPGPLTMVLPKNENIPDLVTSGLDTIAVRVSAHEIMREVCLDAGPIAAPSANLFGRISPTSATAVSKELEGKIPLIVDGGACREGLESTIILVKEAEPGKKPVVQILRPGPVTREKLREVAKVEKATKTISEGEAINAPGQLKSHYAPRTPLYLFEDIKEFEPEEGKKYGLLSLSGEEDTKFVQAHEWEKIVALSPGSGKASEGAVRLFWALRELDEAGFDAIVAEPVPNTNIGVAIMDRLKKASVNH